MISAKKGSPPGGGAGADGGGGAAAGVGGAGAGGAGTGGADSGDDLALISAKNGSPDGGGGGFDGFSACRRPPGGGGGTGGGPALGTGGGTSSAERAELTELTDADFKWPRLAGRAGGTRRLRAGGLGSFVRWTGGAARGTGGAARGTGGAARGIGGGARGIGGASSGGRARGCCGRARGTDGAARGCCGRPRGSSGGTGARGTGGTGDLRWSGGAADLGALFAAIVFSPPLAGAVGTRGAPAGTRPLRLSTDRSLGMPPAKMSPNCGGPGGMGASASSGASSVRGPADGAAATLVFPSMSGLDLSTVTVFLSFMPFWISPRRASRPAGMPRGAELATERLGGAKLGGGGGGGAGMGKEEVVGGGEKVWACAHRYIKRLWGCMKEEVWVRQNREATIV